MSFAAYCLTAAFFIAALVLFPLSLVWKQVYITNTSMEHKASKDSLVQLQKELTALTLKAERLSRSERIESIVREARCMDYPLSKDIVIVRPKEKDGKRNRIHSPFWTAVRKSLLTEKG